MRTVLFAGAGYSAAAGLPWGRGLFEDMPVGHSKVWRKLLFYSYQEWHRWADTHSGGRPEQFLSEAYESRPDLWPFLVRCVAYRLAEPFATFSGRRHEVRRYGDNVLTRTTCPAHVAWWNDILNLVSVTHLTVITTNWDILLERELRPYPVRRRPQRPGLNYGIGEEDLRSVNSYPLARWTRNPRVSGSVPLLKLHGSLNWTIEGGRIVKYGDLRPAFRGTAAIIPPVKGKQPPECLQWLWKMAELSLAEAERILVVGYSFPEYDLDVLNMFRGATSDSKTPVDVFDPASSALCARLRKLIPGGRFRPHDGLPLGTADLAQVY